GAVRGSSKESAALRLDLRVGFAEGEVERSSLLGSCFRPDATTMAVNDPLDGREPDSAAFELPFGMEPPERLEQLVCQLHVEARTIVPYVIDAIVRLDSGIDTRAFQALGARHYAELDARVRVLARVFPGIAEQVLERDPKQTGVAAPDQSRRNAPVDAPLGVGFLQLDGDRARDRTEVDRFPLQLAGSDA